MFYRNTIHESWLPLFQPHFQVIDKFLLGLRDNNIYFSPRYYEIFKSFEVPREKISVILMNSAPSPNAILTDGRAFSSSKEKLTEEVKNISKLLNRDLESNDLSYLETQGILLLNHSLTIDYDNRSFHVEFWELVMKQFLLDLSRNSFIWLLWNKDIHHISENIRNVLPVDLYSDKLLKKIPMTDYHNYVFKSDGPASKGFENINHLERVNFLLYKQGKKQINW